MIIARLVWQRDETRPQTSIAHPAGGKVELLWRTDPTAGPPGWLIRLEFGKTVHLLPGGVDRQHAVDQANKVWLSVLRDEDARVSKLAEEKEIAALID